MTIYEELYKIQQTLKAPKNQRNTFGKYNYRSCEDILEAVKPLLPQGYVILISDIVVCVGDKNYVTATVALCGDDMKIEVTADAREAESQKGMNDAQITGSTSSYARKYALNGLFAIDDNKDPDSTNKHGVDDKPSGNKATAPQVKYMKSLLKTHSVEGIAVNEEFKVDRLENLPIEKVNEVIDFIKSYSGDIPI